MKAPIRFRNVHSKSDVAHRVWGSAYASLEHFAYIELFGKYAITFSRNKLETDIEKALCKHASKALKVAVRDAYQEVYWGGGEKE